MSEKQGIQGGENEADGRNSNQGHKDFRKNEDTIKLIQNDVDRNSEEKFTQDKDETVSDNSDHKNFEGKYSQINKVVVPQELECGGDKKVLTKTKLRFLSKHRTLQIILRLKV